MSLTPGLNKSGTSWILPLIEEHKPEPPIKRLIICPAAPHIPFSPGKEQLKILDLWIQVGEKAWISGTDIKSAQRQIPGVPSILSHLHPRQQQCWHDFLPNHTGSPVTSLVDLGSAAGSEGVSCVRKPYFLWVLKISGTQLHYGLPFNLPHLWQLDRLLHRFFWLILKAFLSWHL